MISDGIIEKLKDPVYKKLILAEVAKEISENPKQWAGTIATLKAMDAEARPVEAQVKVSIEEGKDSS